MAGWQSISVPDGLGRWRDDWDRMNRELYDEHPLFDSRFIGALLDHFGTGNERLLVLTENGVTEGMTILRRRPLGVWESFLPPQLQAAPVLVSRAENLDGIFDALPIIAWQISFLCQDPQFSPFEIEDDANMVIARTPHALTMQVDAKGAFDDYWQGRSKNLQKNIKRYQSRTNREGMNARIDKLTTPADMGSAIKRFGILESTGWKGRKGTAVNASNTQGRFYRDLLENYAASGQAEVYEYYLNDTLAASRIVICGPKIKVILKTAYSEEARRYSPGRILLFEILREEIQQDARHNSIEFYTDATEDQLKWCSSQRWIYHASVYRNRAFRRLHELSSLRNFRQLGTSSGAPQVR